VPVVASTVAVAVAPARAAAVPLPLLWGLKRGVVLHFDHHQRAVGELEYPVGSGAD